MRILIVNYRFYVSGGPERYMFNLKDLLESHGHEVIPFSVRYERNEPTPYASFFVPPLSTEKEVYFVEHTWTVRSFLRTLERTFYSPEVYRKLEGLVRVVRPQFAVVLHYLRKLSPAVLTALAAEKVPFVVRLSDFGMVCPNCHLLRNDEFCELCVTGRLWNSVRYRCVQNSLGASLVNYAATDFHRRRGYFDLVRMFITPSRLLREKMIAGGWAHERLEHIPTFVYPFEIGDRPKKRQILYAGRINPQKGVDILIRAVAKVQGMHSVPSFATVIAGNGGREYLNSLQTLCEQEGTRDVAFVGEVTKDRLAELFQDSLVSVAPSISYDNAPNVMLESMACGTPVIASNQGSFPELITHEHNGLLFQTRSVDGLAAALIRVLEREIEVREMGEKARAFVLRNHSPELHYQKLMNVYSKLST